MRAAEKAMRSEDSDATSRRDALLLRLAAEPGEIAAERGILPGTLVARLDMILGEIDGIVLPRRLHIKSGPRDVARLIVSHRRLVGVEMPGRPPISPDSPNLALSLAARLVEISEWRGEVSLSVSRRAVSPDHAEIACSVASLRQALDLAMTESAFDRLLRLAEVQTLAQLRWTARGAQVQFSGTPALRTTLHAIAANYMKMRVQSRADGRTGALRTEGLLIPVEPDLAIVVASLDKQGFAAILPREAGLELISAWQSRS
jgi:hypothetical protein